MQKVYTLLWRKAHVEVKSVKKLGMEHFRTFRYRFPWQAQGIVSEGFVAFLQTMAGVGHLKRICKDAFRVARAVKETCSLEMLQ